MYKWEKITARIRELKGDVSVMAFARKCGIKQPDSGQVLQSRVRAETGADDYDLPGSRLFARLACRNKQRKGVCSELAEIGVARTCACHRTETGERDDGYLDLVVHDHEEMLKGIQGIAKMRKGKRSEMSNIEFIDSLLPHIYEKKARINVNKMLAYFNEYTRRRKDKSYDPLTAQPMNDDGLAPQDTTIIQCVADFVMDKHTPLNKEEESYAVSNLQLGYVRFLKCTLG